jgi:hypothetical protein
MDLVGWGMRVTVIAREYATQEIAARVFGNRGASGGFASGRVAWLEDPGTSRVAIGGGIWPARPLWSSSELSRHGQPLMQSQRRSAPSPSVGKPRLGRPVLVRSPHRESDAVRPAHRLARTAIRAAVCAE